MSSKTRASQMFPIRPCCAAGIHPVHPHFCVHIFDDVLKRQKCCFVHKFIESQGATVCGGHSSGRLLVHVAPADIQSLHHSVMPRRRRANPATASIRFSVSRVLLVLNVQKLGHDYEGRGGWCCMLLG